MLAPEREQSVQSSGNFLAALQTRRLPFWGVIANSPAALFTAFSMRTRLRRSPARAMTPVARGACWSQVVDAVASIVVDAISAHRPIASAMMAGVAFDVGHEPFVREIVGEPMLLVEPAIRVEQLHHALRVFAVMSGHYCKLAGIQLNRNYAGS